MATIGDGRRFVPHAGQTTQAGSSRILLQLGQRFGANGSEVPQYGHAITSRLMNLPQYGHGCLKVGIRNSRSVRMSRLRRR